MKLVLIRLMKGTAALIVSLLLWEVILRTTILGTDSLRAQ